MLSLFFFIRFRLLNINQLYRHIENKYYRYYYFINKRSRLVKVLILSFLSRILAETLKKNSN